MNTLSKVISKISKCTKMKYIKITNVFKSCLIKINPGVIIFLELSDMILYIVDLFIIKMPIFSLLVYTNVAIIVCTCFTVLLTDAFYEVNEFIVDKLFEDNSRIGIDTLTTGLLIEHMHKFNRVRPE